MSKGFYSFFLSLSLLSTHRKTRIMKQKYGEHITKVKKNNCIKTTRELYLPRIIQTN